MASLKVHGERASSPQSDGLEGGSDAEGDSFSSDSEPEIEDVANDANAEAQHGGLECPAAGWADAMAKILNKKTPGSKPIILLKNKQLLQEKAKEQQEKLEKRKQLDEKRQWEMMCRVKPDVVKDREAERNLQKIATRGVVQLFNAVRKHQSNVNEKVKQAGSSERKRAKLIASVSKKDFIDVLRGKKESKTSQTDRNRTPNGKQVPVKPESGPEWSILRDDFMMGATMKDWDKKSDDGVEDVAHVQSDAKDVSDTDSDR